MADRELKIRMLLQAADKFTKPFRDLASGSSKAAKSVKEAREQLKSLERAQADAASFRKVGGELRSTTRDMVEARTKVQQLAREVAATDSPTKRLTGDLAKARKELEALAAKGQRQSTQLREIRERMRAAGAETGKLSGYEQGLALRVANANRELEQQESRLTRLTTREKRLAAGREAFDKGNSRVANMATGGVAAIGTGIAVAAPEVSVVKSAIGFENVLADVNKVVNFSAGNSIDKLRGQIIDLSKRLPMTAEGIGQIVAAAGRSGLADTELLSFAEDATKMAVAFDMSAEEAGTMMATWRTAFHTGRDGVRRLGDQVNALTNKYGGNVVAVNEIVTRIGPLGEVAGTASGQIAAMAQMMSKMGLEADVGATGIKNTLLALARGSATTPHASQAFKQLGLDAVNVAKRMQKEAGPTILDVFARIAKLSKDQQSGVLTRLFGRESIAAIAPLLTNLDQLRANFAMVGDATAYAGSMEKEYITRAGTTGNALQLADNRYTALKITLGTQLLPTVVKLAGAAGRLATRIDAWSQAHPTLSRNLLITAGALSGLMILFGGLAVGAAAFLGPLYVINAGLIAMGVAGGLASIGLLPIIGTVALVVAGIAALAGAAYLVIHNWGAIAGFFGNLWGRIVSGVRAAAGAITGAIGSLWSGITSRVGAAAKTVGGALRTMWGGVKALFSLSTMDVLNGIAYFAGNLLGRLVRVGAAVVSWLGTVPGLLSAAGSAVLGGITQVFSASAAWLTTRLPAMLSAGWNAVMGGISQAVSASWTWLTTRLPAMLAAGWNVAASAFQTAVHATFVTLPAMFVNFGAQIVNGLIAGIKSAPAALWNAFSALAHSAADGFRAGAGIHSPSRLFMTLGGYLMSGLDRGIAAGAGLPIARMGRLTRDLAIAGQPPQIARMQRLSGRVASAIAVGTAASASIAAPPGAAARAHTAAPAGAAAPFVGELHIHPAAGMDERQLAALVEQKLRALMREQQARGRSSYADDPDRDTHL